VPSPPPPIPQIPKKGKQFVKTVIGFLGVGVIAGACCTCATMPIPKELLDRASIFISKYPQALPQMRMRSLTDAPVLL
jgi:hypothetical protein